MFRLAFAALSLALLAALPQTAKSIPADSTDFGDAPEEPEHYPSCLAPSAPGTRGLNGCPPRGSEPGLTGFIKHVPSTLGRSYWLGCVDPGIDFETDAKNGPVGGPTCSTVTGDCVEDGYVQDECRFDGVDSSVPNDYLWGDFTCAIPNELRYRAYNAGNDCVVYLNILVDMNYDGDWNDAVACQGPGQGRCSNEWALKNSPIELVAGCNELISPEFFLEAHSFRPVWTRFTLTDDPVDDDFPWKGSSGLPGDAYSGGETEDHQLAVIFPDPVVPSTWGGLKILYR